jgi:molybdate transport system substrate-binding protein
MPELARRFEQQTGARAKVSYGSSGTFSSQLQNGAPFDVFFSADAGYPEKLEAANLTEPGTRRQYAMGKLVLWVRNESRLDLSKGMQVLLSTEVKKVAIANPAHAPYGRAAEAALRSQKVYGEVSPKLVMGENISQTAQFVETGNADAAIIALSLATAPAMKSKGRYAEIPASSYPALQQACVVLKSSRQKKIAKAFVEYVTEAEGKQVLKSFGFGE